MRPDRCGTGRPLSLLHPGDRRAVEEFDAFLSGELAMDVETGQYFPVTEADGQRICTVQQIRDRRDQS